MLELIRKYRAFFMIVFVLAAASLMIVSLQGGSQFAQGNPLDSTAAAAKVQGDTISVKELNYRISRQLEYVDSVIDKQMKDSGNNNPQYRQLLKNMFMGQLTADSILDQMINEKHQVNIATRLKLLASPYDIQQVIEREPYFQKDGKFDLLAYKAAVKSTSEYEKSISDRIALQKLGHVFNLALAKNSKLEEENNALLSQKYIFETAEIDPAKIPEQKRPSASEVASFLKDPKNEVHLQSYYNRNLAKYVEEEEAHARHILLKSEDKALEALKEIQSKKLTFADAAKKYSHDKSNKDKGGDLGFFKRGKMVPEFEKAAFTDLKPKEITTKPVKTQFGWHIIELMERKDRKEKPFEFVKKDIAEPTFVERRRHKIAKDLVSKWSKLPYGPTKSSLKKYNFKWEKQTAWQPKTAAVPVVGELSSEDLKSILALSSKKPFLNKAFARGDKLVLLKLNKVQAIESDESSNQNSKFQDAFQFYVDQDKSRLEKSKQIYKNTQIVSQFNEALKSQQGR